MNPILSIIVPCYNSEATLEATLKSILNQEYQEWEAIIVNDGSEDDLESIALKYIKKDSRFLYFKKENGGLGSARNYGIEKAKGKFIVPLDSDNQIEKEFTKEAISIFKDNSNIGVVYGNAEYYGEKSGIWEVGPFDLNRMLAHNYIDACAIYKKSLWEQVGGYDENMPHQGHEDWSFWIALISIKVKFYYLRKITFKYYVSSKSMINNFTEDMVLENQDYIISKYSRLYHAHYRTSFKYRRELRENFLNNLKSRKFVVDLICDTFFSFKLFNSKLDEF
ncbi:glycosyltransferase family A protein [Algibacter aquimarinus]|uniref:Glycosyltransferase n=1 Tax=Algibacter aquimarinus TaxID=1136748 RepID=A0ABP9HRA7_9FLAO